LGVDRRSPKNAFRARRDAVAGVALAAAAAVMLAGCGASGSTGTTAMAFDPALVPHVGTTSSAAPASAPPVRAAVAVPSSDVTRSVADSEGQAGFQADAVTLVTESGGTSATVSEQMSYSAASQSFGGNIVSQADPTSGSSQPIAMQMVLAGDTIYMKLPAALTRQVPGGKPWWSINSQSIGALTRFNALAGALRGLTGKSIFADYFAAIGAGSGTEDLGPATVDGFRTTHYVTQIPVTKELAAMSNGGDTQLQQLLAAMTKGDPGAVQSIDLWIDTSGLVRRIVTQSSFGGVTINGRIDFLHYGPQPSVSPPPASETLDIGAFLAQHGIDAG
jgi:hypothetical protein